VLRDAPEAIASVHRSYLEAGADVITTASYQATFAGFAREGLSHAEAGALIQRSVDLALAARDAHERSARVSAGPRRLVAASIGPYGAFLADGAEYTGAYDRDEAGLVEFHRERLHLLARSGADLLACETLPSLTEGRALARLLEEAPGIPAWLSFSCRDEAHISDGTPFAECIRALEAHPRIVALGVNCSNPRHVEPLLRSAAALTAKPLVAYPNSGELYDASKRSWRGAASSEDWGASGLRWRAAGARLIGGCCRTGPGHIRALRAALDGEPDGI
jgi:homocysteine S-methyltransferase